jgi:hypothetical protein
MNLGVERRRRWINQSWDKAVLGIDESQNSSANLNCL